MKKIFAFAIAAATMAVGCQKIQSLVNPNDNDSVDDGTPVPVVFGTNVATVSTKAAIDGTAFSGQELTIYGVNDATGAFLDNMDPATVTASGNEITVANAFYGVNKETYSFFGYHAGDATSTPSGEGKNVTVNVTIDGNDDVLIGTADKATADLESTGLTVSDLYSAKSARKNIKPELTFNHQLVRFDFKIENGTTLETDETITIDKIGVKSVNECTLNLAEGTITYDTAITEPETEFTLTPNLTFEATGETTKDAGSLMVMPGLSSYPLAVTVTSNGKADTSDLAIKGTFEAGKKYEVTVKVYGSEAIVLSVSLVDWESGDPITIDPDSVE